MGAGLGSGFSITFFLFAVAFFVVLRAVAPRFAFLGFFGMVNLPIGSRRAQLKDVAPHENH